ncbi:MAG: hypothetical protein ACK5JF_00845 [Oscillospiraceae bacterium]
MQDHKMNKYGFARLLLAIYAAVFGCVFVQILLFNTSFGYRRVLQVVLVLGWLLAVGALALLASRFKAQLYRRKYWVLAAVMLLVFGVQVWVGIATKQQLNHDYGEVFNGAVLYATKGANVAEFEPYTYYVHHFANNAGMFTILQLLFTALNGLGLTCFYEAAVVMGHLLFALAILFAFLYLNRAFGPGAALFSLLFWVAFLPVYFQSSIAYTDTYTIFLPPLILYCHQRAKTTNYWPVRIALYAAVGALAAFGLELKATIAITAVAVVLEVAVCCKWKQLLALVLVGSAAFCGVYFAAQGYKHATIWDKERLANESLPITHWVMMVLNGDGAYSGSDEWDITMSVPGKAARGKKTVEEIQSRLQNMGPGGFLQLLHRKPSRTFGSGNGNVDYLLVRMPDDPGHFVYQIITPVGRLWRYFDISSQAVYLGFYVLGVAGAVVALVKKKKAYLQNTAPFLALVGFYVFMMLWESNHRQLVNQWPLFIITAAAGAAGVYGSLQKHLPFKKTKQ